jgi:hypothetical protein
VNGTVSGVKMDHVVRLPLNQLLASTPAAQEWGARKRVVRQELRGIAKGEILALIHGKPDS